MKTFQLLLPEEVLDRARAAAKQEGISLAGFIRQLVIKRLAEIGK